MVHLNSSSLRMQAPNLRRSPLHTSIVAPPHSFPLFHKLKRNTIARNGLKKPTRIQSQSTPYKPGMLDDVLLRLFRKKMVQEVGWDSDTPGYDGLIEVANRLLIIYPTNQQTAQAAVRILTSLFPPFLLQLFQLLVAPLANGQLAAIMVARVTALSCQWLMGSCKVNSVDLADGISWEAGVLVERCRYLEESKCVGICINTCKLPTQTFFKDYMGVPLTMEPNFNDYSCQFKFGLLPRLGADDEALREPCLEICPNVRKRRKTAPRCPKL